MSRKPENQFVGGIHLYLPPTLYRLKVANPYISGVADWWYSGVKSDLWIEYKYIPKLPASGLIIPKLTVLQMLWFDDRYQEGRSVRVIVGAREGGVVYSCPDEWHAGIVVGEFREKLATRRTLAERIMETVGGSFESVASNRKGHISLAIDGDVATYYRGSHRRGV